MKHKYICLHVLTSVDNLKVESNIKFEELHLTIKHECGVLIAKDQRQCVRRHN